MTKYYILILPQYLNLTTSLLTINLDPKIRCDQNVLFILIQTIFT